MTDDHQGLLDSINAAIRKQIEETWAAGRPITVGRDGKVIEIYPDGHEVVISDTGKLPVHSEKREYKL
ncbi:MAG: hypothetical protein PHN69_07425 [Candidatus Pacebacteria bacterium]|nr:hypothetical protein [Candidatus Paceibacterota bacterium]